MVTQRIVFSFLPFYLSLPIRRFQRTSPALPRTRLFTPRPGLRQANFFMFQVVGVTGFEPVTLRLSSACSNQLSYTPMCGFRRLPNLLLKTREIGGAEEIRTPDL